MLIRNRFMAFGIAAAFFLCTGLPAAAEGPGLAEKKERAKAIAAEITGMRSSLAKSFIEPDAEITPETFKKVCGAVGARAKEISKKEGLRIRHAAVKYRNPANRATEEEASMIELFDRDRTVAGKLDHVEMEGKAYLRYTAPIFVEDACLACHGPRDKRPAFIVEKYAEDRAYGFDSGDIRGIISVLMPE